MMMNKLFDGLKLVGAQIKYDMYDRNDDRDTYFNDLKK